MRIALRVVEQLPGFDGDDGRDIGFLKPGDRRRLIFAPDDGAKPNGAEGRIIRVHQDKAGRAIAFEDRAAAREELRQPSQLHAADGSLHIRHLEVEAHRAVVAAIELPVVARRIRQGAVGRHDHAALAGGCDQLRGIE